MNKICFYSISTELGGAERSLLEYLRFVSQDPNCQAELLLPKSTGPLAEEARALGITCRDLPMPPALLAGTRQSGWRFVRETFSWATASYLFQLIAHFRATRPSVIYTTGIKCHALAAVASLFCGSPVLWHIRDHFTAGPTRFILRLLMAITPRTSAVANSEAAARSIKAGTPVVYNGVSPRDFPFTRDRELHRELGLPISVPIVGIVGVLARWKGQIEFLRMARELCDRGSPAHFVVLGAQIYDTTGDQGYEAELKILARDLGIDSRVSFLGFRRDSAPLLSSMDVLVHASIRPEPFGRVIIEAMASGTPVTASAAGGPLEILEHAKTGLLHQPGDPIDMANNVEKLLTPDVADTLRHAAHASFREKFTHDQYNQKLHEQVLGVMPRSARRFAKPPATGA